MTTPAISTSTTQHSAVRPALVLPFDVQPDLAGTMDIQIPSLAWEPLPNGRFRRVYYLDGLFRVVGRLGLAQHAGANNKTTREALVNKLLAYGPDLASAHFLFLLVGRDTCFKASPTCTVCFLQPHCYFATNGPGLPQFPHAVAKYPYRA
jgi:hypothetical protein